MAKIDRSKREPMPEQPADERVCNFAEVALGYELERAAAEAARCLKCRKPVCVDGCPVGVDIPGFIGALADGDIKTAAAKIQESNLLPAICGRVCPQETQCEERCVLGKRFTPIAIGRLERFAADYMRLKELESPEAPAEPNGMKVAVVGSGPGGLTAAGELARLGYEVTIFEALHQAGGVLVYGIPEFRLPKSIVEYEINKLLQLGVKIELNVAVGLSVTVDELLEEEGFDAVFVAVGAGLPTMMSLPGENLGGIYAASEYLTRANLMGAWRFPDSPTPLVAGRHVAVVGGGNVAMDAARTARRLGADAVTVIYRRSREEMPARAEEVHHAEEEGIEFRLLCNPVRYLPDEQGRVGEVECLEMELGEPDDSGRRRPVPKQGSEFRVPADLVIVAIGSRANPILTTNTQNLELNRWGYISADDDGRTSKPRVWAGGDIVTGAATVIEAMGAGKRAAWDIHRSLSGEPVEPVAAEDT